MPSYGAESREGYLSSRSRSRLRSGCGCGCGCTSKWMTSGNHITPINHTFANVFYGCKRILKTFWLISFKYCQWADSDKVSPCESRLMQCALTLAFPSHFPPGQSLTLSSIDAGERERRDSGDGGGRSTVIAWHSSAHPLIRQREKPETAQIFGVGVDSVL